MFNVLGCQSLAPHRCGFDSCKGLKRLMWKAGSSTQVPTRSLNVVELNGFEVTFNTFRLFNDFPVLLVEEDLRIIQTEYNHRTSASNWKLSYIKFSERAELEPMTLA